MYAPVTYTYVSFVVAVYIACSIAPVLFAAGQKAPPPKFEIDGIKIRTCFTAQQQQKMLSSLNK